jgi:hypothetical protein
MPDTGSPVRFESERPTQLNDAGNSQQFPRRFYFRSSSNRASARTASVTGIAPPRTLFPESETIQD